MRFIRFAMLTLAVALVTTAAPAAGDLGPLQIASDQLNDHELWGDPTPGAFDMTAMYISETRETVDVTWEYADIPDMSGGLFIGNYSYFEFTIEDATHEPVIFSLQVRPYHPRKIGVHVHCDTPEVPVFGSCYGVGPGGGSLASNCTTTGTVISCKAVPGSLVDVTVDDIANTITATMRRIDLRSPEGDILANDGAIISEQEVFRGPATCQGVVLILNGNCDVVDMDDPYVLGTPRA